MQGLVLAGGESRRFGRDKAREPVGDATWTERAAALLDPLCGTVHVSVGDASADPAPGRPRLVDPPPGGEGPLAAIVAALERLDDDLLVLACDYPTLESDLLVRLAGAAREDHDVCLAVDPQGREHPLVAVWRRSGIPGAREVLADGQRAVHAALRRLRVQRVRFDDAEAGGWLENRNHAAAADGGGWGGWTHLDEKGAARMVDVGDKPVTARRAVARAVVRLSPRAFAAVKEQTLAKGDALAVARLAGIQAAKRTSDWIPLCHTIPLDGVDVDFSLDAAGCSVEIRAGAAARWTTGVEMEALVAAAAAGLALIDMTKSLDRGAAIERVELVEKRGGKSGTWRRDAAQGDER